MSNPLIVDNTSLSGFRRCPRFWQHRFGEGLTTDRTPAALNFGIAIHAGRAAFARGATAEEAMGVALRSMSLQEAPPEGKEEWRNPQRVVEVLEQVFAQTQPNYYRDAQGQPVVEADFLYPLVEKGEDPELDRLLAEAGYTELLYSGIVDALEVLYEEVWVQDTKTTTLVKGERGMPAFISSDFERGFRPHAATMGYLWGVSKFLNRPIYGVIIDGIGVHKMRVLSPNFSAKDYLCFKRFTVSYTPMEIEEWRQNTIRLVKDLLAAKISNVYRQDPDKCFSYFRWCQYHCLCSVAEQNRENLKKGLFIADKWDPLDARKREASRLGGE
jgi:hypothetical protein